MEIYPQPFCDAYQPYADVSRDRQRYGVCQRILKGENCLIRENKKKVEGSWRENGGPVLTGEIYGNIVLAQAISRFLPVTSR